jgi:methylenetetrahydrofolate reductase (NADPH)
VITQFGFDAVQVLGWLTEVRARGIGLAVRVSVPGPASVRRLNAFGGFSAMVEWIESRIL